MMEIRTIAILTLAVVTLSELPAQSIQWTQTYGGSGQDGAESMVSTDDGGLVIAGFKSPTAFGYKDVLLMKTNASGNELWSRTYSLGLNDIARSIRKTVDGGFIVAGMTEVNPQTFDPFLIKTDSAGILQWQRQYDYGFGDDDRAHGVWQTSDGGYIIAGQTWLMHGPFGNYDMYIIKTDANGDVQWNRIFYRENEGGDVALAVQQTNDGGYIIGGFTQSSVWASYIIRTDSLGNATWSNIYPGEWQSECYEIQAVDDGGFILTGTESSFETDTDVLLMKLGATGNVLWKKIYGSVDADQGESIQQLPDGGYVVAGMSAHGAGSYDMYVVRTNASGDSLWTKTTGGSSDDRAFSIVSGQEASYFVAGWAWSYGQGLGDVYLVKLADLASGVTDKEILPTSAVLHQNYPNPFNPSTTITYDLQITSHVTLKVFDILGREVATLVDGEESAGTKSVSLNAGNMASGVYLYRLQADKFSQVRTMLIVK